MKKRSVPWEKLDCSRFIIKSLNMSGLDCHAPPRLNNLAYFLGASLSSFSLFPSSSLHFQGSLSAVAPHTHFPSFSQTELLLTCTRSFQFAESFLVQDQRVSDPCQFFTIQVSHCFWKTNVTEPPTANVQGKSEHLAALYDLNFQLFRGSELCHQPQTGSGEPVGCQLNPTLKQKTQPQPLAFQASKCLRI